MKLLLFDSWGLQNGLEEKTKEISCEQGNDVAIKLIAVDKLNEAIRMKKVQFVSLSLKQRFLASDLDGIITHTIIETKEIPKGSIVIKAQFRALPAATWNCIKADGVNMMC
ncbi:MAG: hypothetical protein ACOYNU_13430, partial [Bacteroidales bacterium]